MSDIKAAGAMFISLNSRRLFMNYRSNNVKSPNVWGFIGGKIELGEKVLKGLSREIKEEIGFIPPYKKVIPLDVFKSNDQTFTYFTFAVMVEKEFIPRLNKESGGYGWFDLDCLPRPLHQGVKAVLLQADFSRNFSEMIDDYR